MLSTKQRPIVGLHHLFSIFVVFGIQLIVGFPLFAQDIANSSVEKLNVDRGGPTSNQEWIVEKKALSAEMLNFYKAYVLIRNREAMGSSQQAYLDQAKKTPLLSGNFAASVLEKLQARLERQQETGNKSLPLTSTDQQLISHVWFYVGQMLTLLEKLKQTPLKKTAEYEYLQTILNLDISKMLVILSSVQPKAKALGCEYATQAELLANKGFTPPVATRSLPNALQKRLKSEQLRVQGDVFSTLAQCTGFPKNIGYFSRSRRLFDQALKLDAKNFKAKLAKGVYYYFPPMIFGGNLKKAAQEMVAVAVQGNRYESYLAYAWLSQVYFKMDEKEKSETTLKQATNLYPKGKLLFYMAQANANGKPLE